MDQKRVPTPLFKTNKFMDVFYGLKCPNLYKKINTVYKKRTLQVAAHPLLTSRYALVVAVVCKSIIEIPQSF